MGCTDTVSQKVTVYPEPDADFVVSSATGCSPHIITVEDVSSGVDVYEWDYGDGTKTQELIPEYEYTNVSFTTESYIMQLAAKNSYGCVDTNKQTITVYPQLEADFDPDTIGCSPLTVSFQNHTEDEARNVWFFGDGKMSTVKEPVNTFINESLEIEKYTVTLQVESHLGCKSEVSKEIIVYPSPEPSFVPSAAHVTLPESSVSFENTTEGDWTYEWDFGDGGVDYQETPEDYTYTYPGTYSVILKAYSPECEDTVIHYIEVGGKRVRASYLSSFEGCVPLDVQFTNTSENATEFVWNLGDGTSSTEKHPSHTYTQPGTYVVELMARDGDEQDIARSHTVTVYENPIAEFDIHPDLAYLPDAQIHTYNKSINAESAKWYFGDGTVSEEYQPTHSYSTEGIYDIALVVQSYDGCVDSIMKKSAVEVSLECDIQFPNVFTPIEDGSENEGYYDPSVPEKNNDIFHPIFNNIVDYNLQIFNRWGEIVFESNELDRGWNGYYKGELSKSDVYVWKCQATCLGGENLELVGNVTLLR
ncbi:MAG: PKD domain-containing protein [Bacteroidales bacterium]